uniref:Odorant-binding protein 17 n=1 Tax=Dastarcus helophoroides TaxID=1169899 RepID=A0A1I9HZQ2_9CUCU|nr:odorant-binding protein 17 [Dastarcus helophoroides]
MCVSNAIQTTAFLLVLLTTFANSEINSGPVPPEVKDSMTSLRNNCTNELNITEEEYQNFDWNWEPKLMCYIQCVLLNLGWITEENVPDFNAMESTLPITYKSYVDLNREHCHNVPDGFHECEKAYNYMRCFRDQDPEKWFLP